MLGRSRPVSEPSPYVDAAARLWATLSEADRQLLSAFAPVGTAPGRQTVDALVGTRGAPVVLAVSKHLVTHDLVAVTKDSTVKLTKHGKQVVSYVSAAGHLEDAAGVMAPARQRLARLRAWRRRRARLLANAVVIAALLSAIPVVGVGLSKFGRTRPQSASGPAFYSRLPESLVNRAIVPARRAAINNGSTPEECGDARMLQQMGLQANGREYAYVQHYTSSACGGDWLRISNSPRQKPRGAIYVKVLAGTGSDIFTQAPIINDFQDLIGPFLSSVGQCIGFAVYLSLPDGSRTNEAILTCHKSPDDAGVEAD